MNKKQQIEEILTNWSYLCNDLQYDPEEFYQTIENKINSKKVDGIKISRVTLSQKGFLSRKRLYLRVKYENLIFDICGAPFGSNTFFFSYWMGIKNPNGIISLILSYLMYIPIVGIFLSKRLNNLTYFQRDTATMFNTMISEIIISEVENIVSNADIEPLPESAKVANDKKLTTI